MENEIRDDRKAAKREQVQQARHYLRGRDLSWLVNRLIEKGPMTEHMLMWEAMEEEHQLKDAPKRGMDAFHCLHALWLVKKLWRRKVGIHTGSGEVSYEYGLRGVHVRQ